MGTDSLSKNHSVLGEVVLFSCLQEQDLAVLEAVAFRKTYLKNSVIINEGDETNWLYIVLKGRANAISIDPNGRQIILNIFNPGDYFGEMSLIDDEPRSATVITKTSCTFLVVRKVDFQRLISENSALMLNMMKGFSKKIRIATKQIEDLAFRDVYGRIARLITDLKNEDGVITEKLTNQEIAFRVGASREMTSRIMTELKNGSFIQSSKGIITVNKTLPYRF